MATPEPKSQEQGNENQALPKLKTTESPSKAPASIIDSPVRAAYTKSIHKKYKTMTREETKQRIAVMQAYVDCMQIQVYDTSIGKWFDTDAPSWAPNKQFRIKPGPSYRPFHNTDECWREIQKHQPFGIMSSKNRKDYMSFKSLNDEGCDFCGYEGESFESAFDDIQFADGTPFGIKED